MCTPYIDSNLVYAAHAYPGSFTEGQNKVTEWERLFGFMAATYPVIVSEWGFNKNGDETTKGTLEGLKNLSWVAFIYHPFDS